MIQIKIPKFPKAFTNLQNARRFTRQYEKMVLEFRRHGIKHRLDRRNRTIHILTRDGYVVCKPGTTIVTLGPVRAVFWGSV